MHTHTCVCAGARAYTCVQEPP